MIGFYWIWTPWSLMMHEEPIWDAPCPRFSIGPLSLPALAVAAAKARTAGIVVPLASVRVRLGQDMTTSGKKKRARGSPPAKGPIPCCLAGRTGCRVLFFPGVVATAGRREGREGSCRVGFPKAGSRLLPWKGRRCQGSSPSHKDGGQ